MMLMRKRVASIVLIFLPIIVVYSRVSGAFYCGFDDFFEIHRAAFEDKQDPVRIITTTHFDTPKYRPLSRALAFATYWLGNGDPLWFRVRNLTFHLLSAAVVYGLGLLLFQSPATALTAALIFGLHPLVNQTVVAAVWTNTVANSLVLMSLFLFLYSLRDKRRRMVWLGLALLSAWITLFFYEAGIMVFGLMYAYLAVAWVRRSQAFPDRRFLLVQALGVALIGASFFAARFLFVSTPPNVVSAGIAFKNALLYMGALTVPIDSILAHDLFGTPLPSEIQRALSDGRVLIGIVLCVAVPSAALLLSWKRLRARLRVLDWPEILFLAAAIGLSLAPFLVYTPHASETYLYLPAAFYALLLSSVLRRLLGGAWGYVAIIAIVALFGAGTWIRNQRVAACGATAEKILSELPIDRWRGGAWTIRLAPFPGEPTPVRYGIYGYNGLSTIDVGNPAIPAAERALQVATRNRGVRAAVVSPVDIKASCSRLDTCFWVHSDGSVSQVRTSGSTP